MGPHDSNTCDQRSAERDYFHPSSNLVASLSNTLAWLRQPSQCQEDHGDTVPISVCADSGDMAGDGCDSHTGCYVGDAATLYMDYNWYLLSGLWCAVHALCCRGAGDALRCR